MLLLLLLSLLLYCLDKESIALPCLMKEQIVTKFGTAFGYCLERVMERERERPCGAMLGGKMRYDLLSNDLRKTTVK